MVTLDGEARSRLQLLREAAGDSILTVHYRTCDARGNGGVSRTTLYRLFGRGDARVRTQERIFHRVVELYRGPLPVLDVKQWILTGDPRGCPLASSRARERGAARGLA
jgi:hypothetical protein